MASFTTSAILLRRIDFGDYDLILTFFTLKKGKITAIAKSAKKSRKRFAGVLELFSVLQVVCSTGRKKGLPVLQEASLIHPFFKIRVDIQKTAYASYWADLINAWLEENETQVQLYHLLYYVLCELDLGYIPKAVLSILFQMRLMTLSGLGPNLNNCSYCQEKKEQIKEKRVVFDLTKGGIACDKCASSASKRLYLSKGTIKQLLWVESGDLAKATRIKFSQATLNESTEFLEEFVCYHLGKQPRSLKFLRQIRDTVD